MLIAYPLSLLKNKKYVDIFLDTNRISQPDLGLRTPDHSVILSEKWASAARP